MIPVIFLLAGGCSSQPRQAATARSPAIDAETDNLPEIALPDLSQMDKIVQQQIGESHQSLMSLVARNAPPADRARSYGETGKLLMAAEYFDAAEPYFRHAQALAPGEMRWPYYLGHVYMAKADPAKATASFERALQLRPDDVATLVWLGGIHLDQGRPELALVAG